MERSGPVLTPPQTQPLASYPKNLHNLDYQPERPGSSAESEFPTLRSIINGGTGSQTLNQLLLPGPPATNGSAPVVKADSIDLLSGDNYNSPKTDTFVPSGEQHSTTSQSQQNALAPFDLFSDASNATNSANQKEQALTLPPQIQRYDSFQSPRSGSYPNGNAPNLSSPKYNQSVYEMQGPGFACSDGQSTPPQQQSLSPTYRMGAQGGESLPAPPWESQPVANDCSADAQRPSYPTQGAHVITSGLQLVGNNPVYVHSINHGQSLTNSATTHSRSQDNPWLCFRSQSNQGRWHHFYYPQLYGNQHAGYGYYVQPQGEYLEQQMNGLGLCVASRINSSYFHSILLYR